LNVGEAICFSTRTPFESYRRASIGPREACAATPLTLTRPVTLPAWVMSSLVPVRFSPSERTIEVAFSSVAASP